VPVSGLPASSGSFAAIGAISCPAPGACVAAGSFAAPHQQTRPFLVTQTHGAWGKAMALPSVTALGGTSIQSLDCPAVGYCAAVGDAPPVENLVGVPVSTAFILTEAKGSWARAVGVAGTTAGSAGLASVSCATPGYCVAGGDYIAVKNGPIRSLLVTETGGKWGSARSLPVGAEAIVAVSCPAKGACAAATGKHLITESGGAWGKPVGVPPGYLVLSLACPRAGYCSADGSYRILTSTSFEEGAVVVDQVGGRWQPWEVLPGTVLSYYNAGLQASPMSCGTRGNCVLYGSWGDQYGPIDEWVADKLPVQVTITSLALSAATLTYGDEQSGLVNVTVTAASGTPGGTVTIAAGAKTLCTITLSAGEGSCALAAKALPPGTYAVSAVYGINAGFAASHATPAKLTIIKPTGSQ
jgi:hypothetical protein